MPVSDGALSPGTQAPDFTLPATGGGTLSLSGYRGGCVVLVFLRGFLWPFCRRHLRQLAGQHAELSGAGAQVLAIVHDSLENARAYLARHPVPFPCLVDVEHRVYDLYQVESKAVSLGQRPGLFVIDSLGKVLFAHIGRQQWEIPSNAQVLRVCRRAGCAAPP